MELAAAALIVAMVLFDVFQSVVVPRWTSRVFRIAPILSDGLWPAWRRIGLRSRSSDRREDFLGTFAPMLLIVILLVWVLLLILGYGLGLFALGDQIRPRSPGLGAALYLAGTSLFTVGFGDMVATSGFARTLLLFDAASGLATVALVISLLFTLFGSFQRREVLVLTMDARGGAPPSGVTLLETYARLGCKGDLNGVFAAWEVWSAEVLESHRAHPILPYFRSAHQNESWISALGAVLDASTLLLTTIDEGPQGAAFMMQSLGIHAVLDLSSTFRLPRPREAGVERSEFDQARARLECAGYRLHAPEESWIAFSESRSAYAGPLNALAKHFATPPAQWIGDRSTVQHARRDAHLLKRKSRSSSPPGPLNP